jgi:hypothetical protein
MNIHISLPAPREAFGGPFIAFLCVVEPYAWDVGFLLDYLVGKFVYSLLRDVEVGFLELGSTEGIHRVIPDRGGVVVNCVLDLVTCYRGVHSRH